MKAYAALVERVHEIPEIDSDFEKALADSIGTALMVVRIHRGISQVSLAEMLTDGAGESVTQGYVSKVEKGRTRVSWERLSLFCSYLKCLPSQMIELAEFLAEQKLRPEREVIADLLENAEARLKK
jgi:transcriptional regulator with XRE-family HTH domain